MEDIQNQASSLDEDKKLIEYLDKLRTLAEKGQPKARLLRCKKYYSARFTEDDNKQNITNTFNIIKPIVETKATLVLDAMIATSVRPNPMSMLIDETKRQILNDIADILSGIVDHAFQVNKSEVLKEKLVRDALKLGPGIAETSWDPELSNKVGDIKITRIDPEDFFPDPSAKTIEECNYIFTKATYSAFTLKKMFPEKMDIIDKLSAKGQKDMQSQGSIIGKITGLINGIIGNSASQMYVYDNASGIKNSTTNITVWRCFLKDDTVFIPSEEDTNGDNKTKEQQLKYPYGRCIWYSGEYKLDDKSIDYPFGFPFDIFYDVDTDDMWGQGEVEDETEIQDRINRAWWRLGTLIQKYLSTVMYENVGGDLDGDDFPGTFAIELPIGTFKNGSGPQVLTNNTLSEIESMVKYIEKLEQAALYLARLNETMLTGARPEGVNSGKMIEDLNESPMAGIRSVQRNFKEFMVSVSNKIIVLAQMYYNVPRFIRLANGKKFAEIVPNDGDSFIRIYDEKLEKIVNEIKGDLSLGKYEIEVVPGSELPRTPGAIAQLTNKMADTGYLGDPNDLFVKEKVLQANNFPNYREIITHLKKQQEVQADQPLDPGLLVEKLTGSLKDLPPDKLEFLLTALGFPAGPPVLPADGTEEESLPAPQEQVA